VSSRDSSSVVSAQSGHWIETARPRVRAGPEILGYASAVIRDSKHVNLPSGTDRMNGLEISKMLKNQRVRYGLTDVTHDGQGVAGVGLENETTRINGRASKNESLL
jgi:hypothetical protein